LTNTLNNMTIKEAKAVRLVTQHINPIALLLMPEPEQKAVNLLRKKADEKAKEYPQYFKS